MTSRISHTTVDSRNAHDQSVWWGQVLGFSQDPRDPNLPGHEECMIFSPDGRPAAAVHRGAGRQDGQEPDALRPPAHRPHHDEEVERLLGARRHAGDDRATSTGPAPAGSRWPTPRATSSACCAARPNARPLRPPREVGAGVKVAGPFAQFQSGGGQAGWVRLPRPTRRAPACRRCAPPAACRSSCHPCPSRG